MRQILCACWESNGLTETGTDACGSLKSNRGGRLLIKSGNQIGTVTCLSRGY